MATPSRHPEPQSSTILLDRLAAVLPKGYHFGVYHLSTPPTKTDALFSAPPEERPDKTFCEKHFLALSIDVPKSPTAPAPAPSSPERTKVLVLALEIYIFTTAFSSTFFVSKADSTGYLHLLNLPKGAPSPIRGVSSAFVAYLVEQRRRKNIQSVVSLFARAQAQYLFPGSAENNGKHVLDDRGLVKWWCRVLHPLLSKPPVGDSYPPWKGVKAYLVVPGLDGYETRALLPKISGAAGHWVLGHPLERISHYCREYDWVPPRCLIPKYPDDPKSRFRDELDDEAGRSEGLNVAGAWKSVRTVDQFWEMMAFRQECSSGRMTGFIWVVFDAVEYDVPGGTAASQPKTQPKTQDSQEKENTLDAPRTPPRQSQPRPATTPFTTPRKLIFADPSTPKNPPQDKTKKKKKKKKKKPLHGAIKPRQPHIKTRQRNYLLDRPSISPYYYWPAEGRGRKLFDENGYKRVVELLLRLDFATLERAAGSTERWVGEVGMGEEWGLEVTGKREVVVEAGVQNGQVNNLAGLVKRKREESKGVNVLGAGLVRKKVKPESAAS